jgi:hydrophobic/amphiphilic exporter-1 (mainly G- bacteria), HAE1 family
MSKFFINRPIVAIVIAIITVIVGIVSLLGLPISQFPNIVPPQVSIKTQYTGADALTVEQSVATPIEQQLSGVDNMDYMYSVNANNGGMTLQVVFDLATDPNTDQVLCQMREGQAEAQLPSEVKNSGITIKKSFGLPLVVVSLFSPKETYDMMFLANYATINLLDEIGRVEGVADVQVMSGGQYAMRIWIKPDELAKLNITIPEISSAIANQNKVNPAGQIGSEPVPPGQEFTYSVRAQGRLQTPEEFGNVIVRADPNGSIVRLKDVARIELGSSYYSSVGRFNGKPAAVIAIYQMPGSNALDTADRIRKLFAQLKARFPSDVDYAVSLDTTAAVSAGIEEIVKTLIEALILVILVVFIFLQGWRATLIPLLAVPVSLIGTFAFFPLLGFSVNTLSLFGLVLAIGLVVDDAIVVVEAVETNIEKGLSPKDATLKAMEEVSSPVIAIALILTAVFVPTIFIPGITGRLYQQFAVTTAISVLISAFNALTLSPALASLLLRPKTESRGPLGRFFGSFNRMFTRATNKYVAICGGMIRKTFFSFVFLAIFVGIACVLGAKLPGGFVPEEDQGYMFVHVKLPDASSLQRTDAVCRQIEDILKKLDGVKYSTTVTGYNMLSGVNCTYNGLFFVSLKDWSERTSFQEKYKVIMFKLYRELQKIPGAIAFPFSPPAIPGIGTAGGVTFILEDRAGKDLDFLATNVSTFVAAASKRPELTQVSTTFIPTVPQVYVDVDRDKTLMQGVNLNDVYMTLQTFMGGYFVNYFNRFGRQWQVFMQAEGEYRTKVDTLGQFYVRNSNGDMVPLAALILDAPRSGPEFTMRYNLFRSAQINASAASGYSSQQAMKALEEVFAETMPAEMGFDYMGMSYQEKAAQEGVPASVIFALSLVFVFLILAALYESWSLPFSVLLGTPVAVFGAFLFLFVRKMELNIFAQIGLIMLIGLAAKNAILIVEFARIQLEQGKSLMDAALEGAKIRLRPILMTSFAFIFGCVPLAIATGSGAVSRQIMGTAVIGGMLAASFIAIFLIPVTFHFIEKMSGGGKGKENPGTGVKSEKEGGR